MTRSDLADAVAAYYDLPAGDASLYRARVGSDELTLSLLTRPRLARRSGAARISTHEQIAFEPDLGADVQLDDATTRAAIARLAEVEVTDTVMVNSPIYRLMSIDLEAGALRGTVTLSDYASYALTADLMELELVDAVARYRIVPNRWRPPGPRPVHAL